MRRVAAGLLLVCAACSSTEPASVVQPTGRSLLPPSSGPSASPSASPSDDATRSGSEGTGAADTSDGGSAPNAGAEPTKAPTPKPTKRPEKPGIDGVVLAGGQPVTDAQVTISGSGYHHNTTTSSSGRFRSATPPGTYTVAANSRSAGGCGARTVTVPKDAVAHVTITCG